MLQCFPSLGVASSLRPTEFQYNADNQRNKTLYYENSALKKTMYYVENYEKEVIAGGSTNEYDYICTPEGLTVIAVKTNGVRSLYYVQTDHLGSIRVATTAAKGIQTRYYYDAWGKQTLALGTGITNRGYTGHEHLAEFGLINMNARLYDPALGRFLSLDPFVQMPDYTQSYNRYAYCLNNPLIYVDPDGELAWFAIPLIVAGVFATGNTVAHAIRGDINNFGDGLMYFTQGAVVGFAVGCVWQFAPLIPWAGNAIQTGMTWYAYGQVGTGVLGMVGGAINDGWDGLGRAGKLFLGNFYLNEKEPWLGMWQGFTRHTWEIPQSWLGQTVSQVLNTSGITDKVEYWGGATFSTTRNRDIAVSIGNYINVRTAPYDNFDDYILTDQTVMHEYGHTFDSRIWGLSYLFTIGAPSLISADKANRTHNPAYHREKWYERSASRKAMNYFRKYGVIWDDERNPTW